MFTPKTKATQRSVFALLVEITANNDIDCQQVTSDAWYILPTEWKIAPYTELAVSVRAFTVWSWTNVSDARLRSPPSRPQAPQKPRSFVSFVRNAANSRTRVVVHFRWSPPSKPNGQLTGYKVHCWQEINGTRYVICPDSVLAVNVTEFSTSNLLANETYFFSVRRVCVTKGWAVLGSGRIGLFDS